MANSMGFFVLFKVGHVDGFITRGYQKLLLVGAFKTTKALIDYVQYFAFLQRY